MQNPLSGDLFLDVSPKWDENFLKFKNFINLSRAPRPFRKTYIPFYRELSTQITKSINVVTVKKIFYLCPSI